MIRRSFLNSMAACVMALAAVSVGTSGGAAATSGEPDQVIMTLADRAIALLKDSSVSTTDRESRLRALLNDGFDIKGIGRFTLGRHWRKASKQERGRFLVLFEDWIVKTYSGRFQDYSGQTFKVLETVAGDSKRISVVKSEIESPNGQVIHADWHLQKFRDGYKIVDVEVEGVRMAVTQRSEFATIIKRDGLEGLIDMLEKQINND